MSRRNRDYRKKMKNIYWNEEENSWKQNDMSKTCTKRRRRRGKSEAQTAWGESWHAHPWMSGRGIRGVRALKKLTRRQWSQRSDMAARWKSSSMDVANMARSLKIYRCFNFRKIDHILATRLLFSARKVIIVFCVKENKNIIWTSQQFPPFL